MDGKFFLPARPSRLVYVRMCDKWSYPFKASTVAAELVLRVAVRGNHRLYKRTVFVVRRAREHRQESLACSQVKIYPGFIRRDRLSLR